MIRRVTARKHSNVFCVATVREGQARGRVETWLGDELETRINDSLRVYRGHSDRRSVVSNGGS